MRRVIGHLSRVVKDLLT